MLGFAFLPQTTGAVSFSIGKLGSLEKGSLLLCQNCSCFLISLLLGLLYLGYRDIYPHHHPVDKTRFRDDLTSRSQTRTELSEYLNVNIFQGRTFRAAPASLAGVKRHLKGQLLVRLPTALACTRNLPSSPTSLPREVICLHKYTIWQVEEV